MVQAILKRVGFRRARPAGPGPDAGVSQETATVAVAADEAAPTAYRTFSPKLAPGLTAVGGLLAIAGGLGAWVSEFKTQSLEIPSPQPAGTVMGFHATTGVLIAVVGAVTVLSSLLWLRRWLIPKIVPVLAAGAVIGLAVWRLPEMDRVAQALTVEAEKTLDFASYRASLGWGAWCLVGGAVLCAVGIVTGVLREIDLRRGVRS